MLLNDSTFALQIRELIVHLESENRDQAEVYIEDGLEFLQRSLTNAIGDFGGDRIRETLFAYDQVRIGLAHDDFPTALVAARKAFDAWLKNSRAKEGE